MERYVWRMALAVVAAACGSPRAEGPAARSTPAPQARAKSTTISSAGVGPLGPGLPDDAEAIGKLLPGLRVHMDNNLAEDHEVHEYTALRGKDRVLLLYLNMYLSGPDKVFRVAVFDPMFATATGIAVGSTIGELAAKHPDTACRFERYDPDADIYRVDRRLYCEVRSLPNLAFDLDAAGWSEPPAKIPPARLAKRKILEIGWLNPAGRR